MKKKLLSLALVLTLLLSSLSLSVSAGYPFRGFTDVKTGDWFYDDVYFCYDKELFDGVADTRFAPNEPMTRAMFVQVLANQTSNYVAPSKSEYGVFRDVKSSDWFYGPVQWAGKNGIVNGTGEGEFSPNRKITRQEMVTMLFQYALVTGESTPTSETALDKYRDK